MSQAGMPPRVKTRVRALLTEMCQGSVAGGGCSSRGEDGGQGGRQTRRGCAL